VHTAVGDQAEQVQPATRRIAGPFAGRLQCLVLEEAAVGDRVVDSHQILLDDRPGTEVEMPDLGVAHLALREPDIGPAGGELGARVGRPQLVEAGGVGLLDRVARAGRSKSPPIEDDQRH